MDVLVVFTGGTIGSKSDHDVLKASEGTAYTLLSEYQKKSADDVNFTTIAPLNILSENLKPQDWTILIQAIKDASYEKYDGVIITHGTDTLAYTSALLALYFHHIQIPILLVSSHLPLDDALNNGSVNFATAMAFIKDKLASGVFVAYKNPSESFTSIFYGERLLMSRQLSSHFDSVDVIFASYKEDSFHIQSTLRRPNHKHPLKADFNTNLLYIKPYPGINYDHYNLEDVSCVLHDLYH
ncbi:MAG: asparaginase domain-containing protein, partial [Thiovulaceae bacterium]|nr:asparaginase domain-containing protein [Sulfurimonadaceae bacterium]